MARLPRPHIPIAVRLQVALRQLSAALGGDLELDHDPPLAARKKVRNAAGEIVGYQPDANNPRHLIYRIVVDHRIKTNVRGDHGQYPDRVLIKRARKLEKREVDTSNIPEVKPAWFKKVKVRWPNRPFPKVQRKFQARPRPGTRS